MLLFFITRFRRNFSIILLYMVALETTVPRDHPQRLVVERNFGKEILNVVACEGTNKFGKTKNL